MGCNLGEWAATFRTDTCNTKQGRGKWRYKYNGVYAFPEDKHWRRCDYPDGQPVVFDTAAEASHSAAQRIICEINKRQEKHAA